ncbi:Putative NAD(P)H nitroreductase YodC [Bacillus sp. THAF10]|uniref:nitroreductase family protein n=1 Tax=Bacillus sp. THAF10 TaxID=2587848 RepID=UPI001268E09E|nr:nitroreductase family protein [Bacillus sp. THAF10]QFT89539.1 Putative NAD(P)H nitroreductase YodC [Bacillus sp. THAF10]
MANTTTKSAIDIMKERHSVRKYTKFEMPQSDLTEILEATITAPSSWNLQHWKFLIIQSDSQKEKLLPLAYNQQQVVDSSVTIAILGDLQANVNAEKVYGEVVSKGFMKQEVKDILTGQINGAYTNEQFARDEAVMNSSLAAMQLMLAAKEKGYDTVPMGGFDRAAFVKEFNVPDRYIPVMLISVGKADAEAHGTLRFPLDEVIAYETF